MGLEIGNTHNKYQDHPTTIATSATGNEEPMDILRCVPMSLLQLYIPVEAAQATVAELGSLGLVQFRDVSRKIVREERVIISLLFMCVVE